MDESAHFAGLDIGGTTVKAALLNGTGRQIGEGVELRSHGSDGYKATFKQLHLALETICSNNSVELSTIAAVGIDFLPHHLMESFGGKQILMRTGSEQI